MRSHAFLALVPALVLAGGALLAVSGTAQDEKKLYFFTKKTGKPYTCAKFAPGDFLIFGKETKGLPEEVIRLYIDRCYTIPMSNRKIRSLNLANAAGIVLYEALRQQSVW